MVMWGCDDVFQRFQQLSAIVVHTWKCASVQGCVKTPKTLPKATPVQHPLPPNNTNTTAPPYPHHQTAPTCVQAWMLQPKDSP